MYARRKRAMAAVRAAFTATIRTDLGDLAGSPPIRRGGECAGPRAALWADMEGRRRHERAQQGSLQVLGRLLQPQGPLVRAGKCGG